MKPSYSLDIKNKFTALGLSMMALSVVIRCVYFAVHGGSAGHLAVHLLLPILAAATFFAVVLLIMAGLLCISLGLEQR